MALVRKQCRLYARVSADETSFHIFARQRLIRCKLDCRPNKAALKSVGAICITIGFLTRPFALLLLIEMLFITFKVQMPNGWFFSAQGGGAEFTVMWAALFLIILIRGGGEHSVDRAIAKKF
jgi:uncharacterized membrane protein YphA (DoxX/SURF4 family)